MIRAAAFAFAVLAAAPALAAPPAWTPDMAASRIGFSSSFGGQAFAGQFTRWSADVRFDPADLAHSSARVSIDTASAVTGDADRDAALPDRTWFASKAYPKAVFEAHRFKALGGSRYEADGQLTIKGVTKPLTLPFTLVITGDKAKMTAAVDLDRLAFGVGEDEWKTTSVIPATVRVDIAVTGTK